MRMLIIKIDQQNVEDNNQLYSEWHTKYICPSSIYLMSNRDAKVTISFIFARKIALFESFISLPPMWKLLNLIMGSISPPLLMCDLCARCCSLIPRSSFHRRSTVSNCLFSLFVIITAILNGSMPFACFFSSASSCNDTFSSRKLFNS